MEKIRSFAAHTQEIVKIGGNVVDEVDSYGYQG